VETGGFPRLRILFWIWLRSMSKFKFCRWMIIIIHRNIVHKNCSYFLLLCIGGVNIYYFFLKHFF
jgi:hypothetical protein